MQMRNYLILMLLSVSISLTACGPAAYLADLACENGVKMLRPTITCKVPQYTISFNINEIELKERFELAVKETGCFAAESNLSKYVATSFISKTSQNQILEVKLYQNNSLIDIHAYPCNRLNLQNKVNESVQDILLKISQKGLHYAKNQ
jgi:hypothetical protein